MGDTFIISGLKEKRSAVAGRIVDLRREIDRLQADLYHIDAVLKLYGLEPDEIPASRMRRAEIGHHHHIAGAYLIRYAQEASWREDHRRVDNGAQVNRVASLALAARPSVDFCGYWQRARNAA